MKIVSLRDGRQAIAFLGFNDPFSNFYFSKFEMDGHVFHCVEHAYVAAKLRHLGSAAYSQALNFMHMKSRERGGQHPRQLKWLGSSQEKLASKKEIEDWKKHQFERIAGFAAAKFEQNEALRKLLIATGNMPILEANPRDKVWGVGIAKDDPLLCEWSEGDTRFGKNRMGRVLMSIRHSRKLSII